MLVLFLTRNIYKGECGAIHVNWFNSRVERARIAKEELLAKCERLEAEMSVLRTVTDLQYE